MAYTNALWEKVCPLNPGEVYCTLPPDWPFHSPRFPTPTFTHYQWCQVALECNPEWSYIKTTIILHWVFFLFIMHCPNCHGHNVQPNRWMVTGHREVYGLQEEECILGVQFWCVDCLVKWENSGLGESDEKYCFLTTNPEFWQGMSLWEIPRE